MNENKNMTEVFNQPVILSMERTGRFYIRCETGFKTSVRRNMATRFPSSAEAFKWLRSEGISSEYVKFTNV